MSVYLDSSALVRLYVPEPETPAVFAFVRSQSEALIFSHLHELELKNALRLKVFRKEVSARTALKSIREIDKDLRMEVLKRPELNWPDVFRQAEDLSRRFTSKAGYRSLDALHVASSLLILRKDFLTFDDRQATLARKSGLRLVHISPY